MGSKLTYLPCCRISSSSVLPYDNTKTFELLKSVPLQHRQKVGGHAHIVPLGVSAKVCGHPKFDGLARFDGLATLEILGIDPGLLLLTCPALVHPS